MDLLQSQPTRASLIYLKAIYDCGDNRDFVSTSRLAQHLRVAPASVTAMSQKLAAAVPPLVEYHKHHGVHLTPLGEQYALRLIRRHRLMETFLVQVLDFSWDEVHQEAELLDGCISARLEERIAHFTGDPGFDPHGSPIPTADLSLPKIVTTPLSRVKAGSGGLVKRVRSNDPGLLRYLSDLGIGLGARVDVVNTISYDGTTQVRVNQCKSVHALGSSLASVILLSDISQPV